MKANLLLTVSELSVVGDGYDDATDSWEELRSEWFKLTPANTAEYTQNEQTKSKTTHTAECHYFSGAHSGMKLEGNGRTFHAESVVNRNEANRFLDWTLVESNG